MTALRRPLHEHCNAASYKLVAGVENRTTGATTSTGGLSVMQVKAGSAYHAPSVRRLEAFRSSNGIHLTGAEDCFPGESIS